MSESFSLELQSLWVCIQKALIMLAYRWPFPYTTIKMANFVAVPSPITLY